MANYDVRIERLTNGYTVRMRDPAVVKANEARDFKSDKPAPWRDPNREYVFKTVDEVLKFLKGNLDKALPADSFSSAFDAACVEPDEDD